MKEEQSEKTKRIAKNTIMLYIRMLFGMMVSLYTSRIVLQTLGVEDYGIYNVVGGFVAMFSLISNSLSSSVSRFLTFELGKGNIEKLKTVFSTSVLIHIVLAIIVFICAESIGVWFLNTQMTIPAERLTAANWVFQASIVSFMFGLFSVPYNASIVSHEKMTAFAFIGILNILLNLSIVLFLAFTSVTFDKLIAYSVLLVIVSISLQFIYVIYCLKHFEECRLKIRFDKEYWKEISSFAGWNFIGCTAGLLKDQGVNILLNLFIGPILNAARGIAGTVNNAVSSFAANFMMALNPQITKSYASGEHAYMFSLVERGSRFSYFIMLILTLPIILEAEFILSLWLGDFPDHTVNFVRLILTLSLLDILSNTLITLQNATGKIRNYQIVVGGALLLNFPLSYLCLFLGFPPESTLIVAIIVAVLCLSLRLSFLHRMVGLSILSFLKNVLLKVLIVTVLTAFLPLLLHLSMEMAWQRFIVVTAVSLFCTLGCIYYVGCNTYEQQFILRQCSLLKEKLKL